MKKTNFYICRSNTIHEIQDNFSSFYPTLEINFFSNIGITQPENSCVLYSPGVRIQDISPDCQDGYIELNDSLSSFELEHLFHDNFNLHAEISSRFRKRPDKNSLAEWWQLNQQSPELFRSPKRGILFI
jgi:hypothetical protein